MKISIITVCYNADLTIVDTIASIASQHYPDIEHIVVDGGSRDNTMEIVANAPSVAQFVSESDEGIYDAMNKGIAMASGDVIGFLNADDFYISGNIISEVAEIFGNPAIEACYADLVYVRQKNTASVVRYWRSGIFKNGSFKRGWMPAHPTFFCRKSVYDQFGKFSLKYHIAADVELLFRFLEQHSINTVYIPKVIIKMRLGGTTNQSCRNIKIQNQEVLSFLDAHYGRISRRVFFIGKIWDRLMQFIQRPGS